MKVSNFPISTLRETPAEAELISHQLMLKAGLIKRLASGLYTWGPFGVKVMHKVEKIVREEMANIGAVELFMPSIQPSELWEESGRWQQFGPELLRMKDRKGADFCYGPTHEEVITDYVRSREFIMKDAYSFHTTQESLQATYDDMHRAYTAIFSRMEFDFRAVQADSGSIGGSASQEFHVLADSGEDAIAFSNESNYAANVEMAVAIPPLGERPAPSEEMQIIETPNAHTIDAVSEQLGKDPKTSIKSLLVKGEEEGTVITLLMQGNDQLNELKAEKLAGVLAPLTYADEDELMSAAGCNAGSIGPVGLKTKVYADHATKNMSDFVCGANQDGKHYIGVNWGRDLPEAEYVDLRNVVEGDPSPDGKGILSILRGIEVGHIFQLGTKYSEAMNATVLGENGKPVTMTMGCYGVGITRVVAACIEQKHDDNGIIWPAELAPFQLSIVPINYHKSNEVKTQADQLHEDLTAAGYDVLLDDRNMRPGAMFADHELIGIPHRVVISDRGLKEGQLEFKSRTANDAENVAKEEIMTFITDKLS